MATNNVEFTVRDDGSIYFDLEYVDECCYGHIACNHFIDHTMSIEESHQLYLKLWKVFQGRMTDASP